MARASFVGLILIFFIISASELCLAQNAICPITTLKVKQVVGKVVWADNPESPVSNTRIDLVTLGESQELLESMKTDENGFFEFRDVKKGKYALNVYLLIAGSTEVAPRYWVPLKVTRSNSTNSRRHILILRAFDCWDSEAKLVSAR